MKTDIREQLKYPFSHPDPVPVNTLGKNGKPRASGKWSRYLLREIVNFGN